MDRAKKFRLRQKLCPIGDELRHNYPVNLGLGSFRYTPSKQPFEFHLSVLLECNHAFPRIILFKDTQL